MNVYRLRELLVLVLLASASAVMAQVEELDPQSLLLKAHTALERGDVKSAELAVSAIQDLLEADPHWDPDRSFDEHLIPELETRIASLKNALEQLETLPKVERDSPRHSDDHEDIASHIDWADASIAERQADLDRIVETLPTDPERCALLLSAEYGDTAGVMRTEILTGLSETLNVRIDELSDGNKRVSMLKTKLHSLKRDLVASSMEREILEQELATVRDSQRVLQDTLVEFIESSSEPVGVKASELLALERALMTRIRDIWMELRSMEQLSLTHKTLCHVEIERLRLANQANVSLGGKDLIGRIDALEAELESLPEAGNDVLLSRATTCAR